MRTATLAKDEVANVVRAQTVFPDDASKREAAWLFFMVRRGAMSLTEARSLIAIEPRLRAQLDAYARTLPAKVAPKRRTWGRPPDEAAFSIADLAFRDAVAWHFEHYVAAAEPRHEQSVAGCGVQ